LIKRDKEHFEIDLLQNLRSIAPFSLSMELSIEILDEGEGYMFF